MCNVLCKEVCVTSLTAIFGSSPGKSVDESEKLLNLYWNRAELKKAFAELRNEQYRLKDRIKQQEGITARVQQKLDHLEHLLLDPEWIYSVVVHYQFRAMNLRCRSKLDKFAEQLKQQREKRQHRRDLDAWNRKRAAEAGDIERRIGEQRLLAQDLEDRLHHERRRLTTMNGFLRLFRRRSAMARLNSLAGEVEDLQRQETALLAKLEEIRNREPPEVQGLDIPTKRLINFMILAYVQQLYLHFSVDDVAILAKEAGDRSVGAIRYGDKKDCDEISARIRRRIERFEEVSSCADILKERARRIGARAAFRSDDEAVPNAQSVSTVFAIDQDGKVAEYEANLLGEDYWNLSELLSR